MGHYFLDTQYKLSNTIPYLHMTCLEMKKNTEMKKVYLLALIDTIFFYIKITPLFSISSDQQEIMMLNRKGLHIKMS